MAIWRGLVQQGLDVGAVMCGKRSAYVERGGTGFIDEVAKYYPRLEVVDDLGAMADDFPCRPCACRDLPNATSTRTSRPSMAGRQR